MSHVTNIIGGLQDDAPITTDGILPLVYHELRNLADKKLGRERAGQTLTATALVHEAFLRLVDPTGRAQWNTRAHFFGAAAEAMRRILIERARRKKRICHGGDRQRVDLDVATFAGDGACGDEVDLIALDAALVKFAEDYPEPAQLVKLRYFGGLNMTQIAEAMGISLRTAHRHWVFAKARLYELIRECETSDTL